MKTIETKKAASVNEAIEIINRLNYRNDTFEYHGYTREDNADIKYRHFDGYKENGELDGFSLIEIVVNGKLEVIRFFNHFRNITVDIKLGDFNLDYSRYDEVIDADAKIESNAEVESNGNDAEAKTKMKTIETKMATNGVKLYYVDGKRTSREACLTAAADSRENLFTVEYATRHTAYFTGRILDATQVYESTSKAVLKELKLKIDEYHGFAVKLHTIGWVEICKLFNKDYAKSLINKIENAFIRGEYGVKIDTYGKVSILPAPVIEPNPDDYAVNPDALEVAVNAEIQAANNAKINDLKWKIRYVEGSINDLDQNHIAHAPNDQSLKERRAELINELAALKAQLADLLPTEVNTNSEYKYYIQSRRPIAGAVPNGYISATQGEMKAYSLRSDGSISIVPRKVVFGVVVYDHPLSDEQIINYDLHVDPRNPKAEPKTEPTPEVDPIITERQDARNEYYELNHVRNLIEKDVDKIERLRDRCKVGSPKYKAYSRMLADVDPIIRAFGDKFIAAQDRYNQSLTLRTDEERAATQKAIDEHNADLDARGIKYFATVYYYPNGIEGEDMENFFKDCQTLKEATDFVSQEDIDGVYVGGIYDAGWEITDRNGNIVTDHNTGIKMTNTTQAGFLKDKINRESKSIGDSSTDRDEVFGLLPALGQLNDVDDTPVKNNVDTLTADIAKYQAAFEKARQISIRAGASFYKVNGETIYFNYGEVRAIHSDTICFDNYKAEITFKNGKKRFRYEGIAVSRTAFLKIITDARAETAINAQTTDDELIDPPDTEPRYAMTVKETIDDLNHSINWAQGILTTMQGNTYSDDWQDWTRAELETAIADWTSERDDLLTKPYFRNLFIKEQGMTLDAKNDTFISYADKEGNLRLNIFLTHDGQEQAVSITTETEILAYAHSASTPTFNHQQKKSLRDSLNRAIKQCIRNRIGYLKSHNSKMEKYEYELMHLLQGARRELEVA